MAPSSTEPPAEERESAATDGTGTDGSDHGRAADGWGIDPAIDLPTTEMPGPAMGPTGYPATSEYEIVISGYRGVFAVEGTRRLLASALLGRLPLGASSLAILLMVRRHTDSFGIAGAAVGVFAIAGAIAAPFLGALLDRYGPRRILVPSAVLQAIFLTALVIVVKNNAATFAILAFAAAAGAMVPPISACVRVLWARIIPTRKAVETAYALDATTQEMVFTVGPLLVALIISLASPAAALMTVVVMMLAGTAVFVTTPAMRSWPTDGPPRAPGGALASRPLRLLLVTAALFGIGLGALEVGLPALAVANHSPALAGVLLAVWSVGSMIGGLLYGSRDWTISVNVRYAVLLFANALFLLPLLLVNSLGVAIGLSLIAGIPGAAALSCQYILVGRTAPPGAVAEAFTWSVSGLITGIAAGSALAGQIVESTSPGRAFLLAAAATLAGAFLAWYQALRGSSDEGEPAVPVQS